MPNRLFDRVYVINLKRSPDRLRHVKRNFAKAGIRDFEVFEATDGRMLRLENMESLGFSRYDTYKRRNLSAGELGCYLSHVRLWQQMLSRGEGRILICEDDVQFEPGARDIVAQRMSQVPQDWSIVHFYSNLTKESLEERQAKRRPHSEGVLYGWNEGGGTLCYALSDKGAMLLLQHAFPIKYAVDGLITFLTLPNYQNLFPNHLLHRGFILDPPACSPAGFITTIHDAPGDAAITRLPPALVRYVRRTCFYLLHPKKLVGKISRLRLGKQQNPSHTRVS